MTEDIPSNDLPNESQPTASVQPASASMTVAMPEPMPISFTTNAQTPIQQIPVAMGSPMVGVPMVGSPVVGAPMIAPKPIEFMPMPTAGVPSGCPPGLEYLTQVDQLLIHQQIELLEILTGYEFNNKYQVKNSIGQVVYFAVEDNDMYTLNNYGSLRPFNIKMLDNVGRQIMLLDRPCRCQYFCCPCCLQEMRVSAPPGIPIGTVKQKWSCCTPKFELCDATDQVVLTINGECTCNLNVDFKVLASGSEIGCIRKQWSGYVQEVVTNADNFNITFPIDLDVKMKAMLLASTLLIDYMYFENHRGGRNRHAHMHSTAYGMHTRYAVNAAYEMSMVNSVNAAYGTTFNSDVAFGRRHRGHFGM